MIEYVQGDILRAPQRVMAHGCNAKGKFGKGLCYAVGERWPAVKRAYEFACASGAIRLGDVVWAKPSEDSEKLIANVITQATYGDSHTTRYVSYDAVDLGMRRVVERAQKELRENEVAIPFIGAGLGNGHWPVIRSVLEKIEFDTGIHFKVYELHQEIIDRYAVSQS